MKTFLIDAFTDKPFSGSPTPVCLLEKPLDDRLMQSIAAEFNFAETVFIFPSGGDNFQIRYFTPTVEIAFCGHATLASAKLLLDRFGYQSVCFKTIEQLELMAEKDGEHVLLHFPLYNPEQYVASDELLSAFGIENPVSTRLSKDLDMVLIEVENKDALLRIKPRFKAALMSPDAIVEVVVTAKSDDEDYDFYSRCFCPWIGIDEDPVTGSSHCVLAKYWSDKLGKADLKAYQLSARGGYLNLSVKANNKLEIRSNGVILLEGTLQL
jgi:PhzF family phenazine biosynthesis protein